MGECKILRYHAIMKILKASYFKSDSRNMSGKILPNSVSSLIWNRTVSTNLAPSLAVLPVNGLAALDFSCRSCSPTRAQKFRRRRMHPSFWIPVHERQRSTSTETICPLVWFIACIEAIKQLHLISHPRLLSAKSAQVLVRCWSCWLRSVSEIRKACKEHRSMDIQGYTPPKIEMFHLKIHLFRKINHPPNQTSMTLGSKVLIFQGVSISVNQAKTKKKRYPTSNLAKLSAARWSMRSWMWLFEPFFADPWDPFVEASSFLI